MLFPLVSVIIPTYNSGRFAIESIDSVVNQSYPNLEIIISDDCSTDGTQELIKTYLKDKDLSRFKVFFNEKNLGITKNFRQCFNACSGEYIAIHAGDDVMLSEKIRIQVAFMQKNSTCVISYHNMEVFDSETNKILYYYNGIFRNIPRSGNVRKLIKYNCFCGGPSVMIRKSNFLDSDHSDNLSVASDWCMWIEILLKGGNIFYINKVLTRYRRHDNNVTSTFHSQAHYDTLNVINYLMVFHPQYIKESLHALAITIRGIRHTNNSNFYNKILKSSLKISFNFKAAAALILNLITFGKVKV